MFIFIACGAPTFVQITPVGICENVVKIFLILFIHHQRNVADFAIQSFFFVVAVTRVNSVKVKRINVIKISNKQ